MSKPLVVISIFFDSLDKLLTRKYQMEQVVDSLVKQYSLNIDNLERIVFTDSLDKELSHLSLFSNQNVLDYTNEEYAVAIAKVMLDKNFKQVIVFQNFIINFYKEQKVPSMQFIY